MANGPFSRMRQAQQNWRQDAGSFGDRLGGLLSGASPIGNLGLGLLGASGPSVTPQSFGQVLAQGTQFASERQRAAMENQAMREHLQQQAQRSKAQEQIQGLLSGGGEIDQNQLMGLLSQANPEMMTQAMTQGLMGQMFPQQDRAEPGAIRELDALGLPRTPDGYAQLMDMKRAGGASDEMMRTIQLQLQAFQLDEARRKREQDERTSNQQRRGLEVSTQDTFRKARELAELNDALESTALETGQPFAEFSRTVIAGGTPVLERFGVDTQEARQTVANFDRFNKLATDFGIELIERLRGTGTITNQKFQALQDVMAGIGTSPGANRLIIADVIQTALDAADIEDIAVNDRRDVERLIRTLRGDQDQSSGISGMSIEDLGQLDITQMTDDQLEAARKRWEELQGAQ